MNTVYMVLTFAGGASGSLLAIRAWDEGGWDGVCAVGGALLAAAALLLLIQRLKRKPS